LGQQTGQMARFFRVAISMALLALLLCKLDSARIVDAVHQAAWWTILIAVALQMLLFSLASLRWWVLLNYHACGYRPATLLAPYFIGVLFNNILPTALGGSLFRMYYIYQDNHGAVVAASPIVTERLLGLVAMITTATMVVPFLSHEPAYVRVLANTLPWLLALAFAALALIGSPPVYRVVQAALVRWHRFKIVATALRVAEAVQIYLAHPGLVVSVFAISVGLQVMSASVYYLLGLGLGVTLTPLDYLLIAPLVFIAATLPVSIGGLGVREAAAVSLFTAAGMPTSDAGALAFLYLVVLLLSSAPGLFLVLTNRSFRHLFNQARQQPIG